MDTITRVFFVSGLSVAMTMPYSRNLERHEQSVLHTWLHLIGGDSGTYRVFRAQLERAGLVISPLENSRQTGFGIVVFENVSQELYNFLNDYANRLAHVIAVSLSPNYPTDDAWRLLQKGASDVVAWNHTCGVESLTVRLQRWDTIERILSSPLIRENLAGTSFIWSKVLRELIEVAVFTDSSVLVTGETGTGKEMIARALHTIDTRPNKGELILLDCSTIVSDLSGSEFFGHEKGAFTGAAAARDGAFALANGGTLFLDEIGELPLPLQAQLLRAIQEGTYKPVGGNHWKQTRFRLICATNKDLREEMQQGRFRADLYYRISRWTCRLPPLRERREDIPLLVHHFIAQSWVGKEPPTLSDAVAQYLQRREYSGNVRDLKQLVSRILDRHVGNGPITVGDIPVDDRPSDPDSSDFSNGHYLERGLREAILEGARLKDIGRTCSESAVRIALELEQGSLQRAARRLGVTDRALQLRRANHHHAHAS
jgi:transcriptional regulator with GAF, ATPase, and Fis domain